MKTSTFKNFVEAVKTADEKDVIWSAGFLFIDLTERQGKIIAETMLNNPCCNVGFDCRNRKCVFTPLGLGIVIE